MPQQCCPWCGHAGPRYDEGTPTEEIPSAHDDGTKCVCRHVDAIDRQHAIEVGGRYWDGAAWVCPWCGTAPPPTAPQHEDNGYDYAVIGISRLVFED